MGGLTTEENYLGFFLIPKFLVGGSQKGCIGKEAREGFGIFHNWRSLWVPDFPHLDWIFSLFKIGGKGLKDY